MKFRIKVTLAGILFLLMMTSMPGVAQTGQYLTPAESDPHAIALLNKLHQRMAKETLRLNFDMSVTFPGEDPSKYTGTLLQQGKMYHIQTDDAEIWSNGSLRWVYFREANEVNIYTAHDEESQGPLGLVSQFTSDQFIAGIAGTETQDGTRLTLVELKPADRNASVSKVRLALKDDGSPVRMHVFEKTGGRTDMQVQTMQVVEPHPVADFTFDQSKFPGVHVEDLRID